MSFWLLKIVSFFVADFYFGQISVVLEIFRESKKEKI